MRTLNPMNPQRMPADMLITRMFGGEIEAHKDFVDIPLETPDGYAFVAAYSVQSSGWLGGLYIDQYNVSASNARVYKSSSGDTRSGYVEVIVLYRKI